MRGRAAEAHRLERGSCKRQCPNQKPLYYILTICQYINKSFGYWRLERKEFSVGFSFFQELVSCFVLCAVGPRERSQNPHARRSRDAAEPNGNVPSVHGIVDGIPSAIKYEANCISLTRWPIIAGRFMRRTLNAASCAVFASLTLLACASSALPQSKPNRSEQDLNAIGHRNVGGSSVNFFSREKELALGKQLAQEVERSSRMIDDPVVSEYLNRLTQSIAKNSDAKFPINVRIIDSNEINAFTLPGGYQYVNRGLILATNSEAELAGVLAYGIAHTALRTGTRQATKGEMTQLSSIPAMVFTPYTWAGYAMYQGLNMAIPLNFLKFSREAVSAADFYGVEYLYKAGYDAEAYPRLLERVQQPPKSQNISKAFSTHPPLPERLKAIREEIARFLPPRPAETVSSSDFEAVKERLRAWQPPAPAHGANPKRPTLRKPGETPTR